MDALTQLKRVDNVLLVQGKVNSHTVNNLLVEFKDLFKDDINKIDCSHIEQADSTAISFLLVCLRQAHKQNMELDITGMGEQLLNLASLYGVEQLLEKYSA